MTRAAEETAPVAGTRRAVAAPVEVRILPTPADRDPVRAHRRRGLRRVLPLLPPLLLLVAWEVAGRAGALDRRIFPPPSEVASDLGELTASGELWVHVVTTTWLILLGFLAGAVVAIPLGLVIGRLEFLRILLNPTVAGAYTVPKLALFPLLLLAFGIGDTAKIVLIGITSGLIVLISTIDAVAAFPTPYLDAARTCGSGPVRTMVEVVVPGVAGAVFTSLRLAIGTAVLITIATEFLAANAGLGYLIWTSWSLFQPGPMYVGIVASALLGVLLVGLVGVLERVVTPWTRLGSARRRTSRTPLAQGA